MFNILELNRYGSLHFSIGLNGYINLNVYFFHYIVYLTTELMSITLIPSFIVDIKGLVLGFIYWFIIIGIINNKVYISDDISE